MAGSEVNGIEGARATLFENAHWILCPDEQSDPEIFMRLHEFVTSLGARSITLPRAEHDETIAVVSHVPHMVASALVQLAGAHARDKQEIFRLAAGGFKDTTRIAAGSPELWCGIALDNHEALARGLGEIRQVISQIETSLKEGNARELMRLLENAATLRSSIPSTWVPDSARLVEVRIPMANRSGVIAQATGFAGKAGCNIQSIDIDHINEATAILEMILTDEGDMGRFMNMLIDGGFDVSIRPLGPRE
jgi:prephenate dehydrogenase